jgi:ornithine--oxo-acid transaminase
MASADTVVRRLLRAGVLTRDTHRNTVRFAPPLIIDEQQIDWAIDRLTEVLEETAASAVHA